MSDQSVVDRAQLVAYLLTDGHSYEVHQLFMDLTHAFDAASGQRLDLVGVGDPAQSGPNFIAGRTPEEAARATERVEEYLRVVVDRDRERFHVVAETRQMAEILHVPLDALPCVAFARRGDNCLLGTLTIEPGWFLTPIARHAFGLAWEQCLTTFESPKRIEELQAGGLDPFLSGLKEEISLAVHRGLQASRQPPVFKTPEYVVLELRADSREVWIRRASVVLSKTPFALLLALANRAGQFIDVADLATASSPRATDSGFDPARWAQNHVRAIRDALSAAGSNDGKEAFDLIEAGTGRYRLRLEERQVLVR